jgi:hypothetical protein
MFYLVVESMPSLRYAHTNRFEFKTFTEFFTDGAVGILADGQLLLLR